MGADSTDQERKRDHENIGTNFIIPERFYRESASILFMMPRYTKNESKADSPWNHWGMTVYGDP